MGVPFIHTADPKEEEEEIYHISPTYEGRRNIFGSEIGGQIGVVSSRP